MRDVPIPPELALDVEPFDAEALDRLLDSERAVTTDVDSFVDRWQVTDDGAAEWTLRKLAECNAELARLEELQEDWSRRLDEWWEKVARPHERRRDWFAGHLERYALARRADSPLDGKGEPRIKSVLLPSGRLSTTKHAAKVVVEDEAAVIAWARENLGAGTEAFDEVVRIVEGVHLRGLRERIKVVEHDDPEDGPQLYAVDPTTGEQVPGLSVEPESITATVKAS